MSTTPTDQRLFELFCDVVEAGLKYVRLADSGRIFIGTHDGWPKLMRGEDGLPYVTYGSEGPRNYGDVVWTWSSRMFGLGSEDPAPEFEKEPSFIALVEYAKSQPRLSGFLALDSSQDIGIRHLQYIIGSVLDHYVNVNKATECVRDKLLQAYLPIERCLLQKELPIVVVVPILLLTFELDQFRISDTVWVGKLSDDLQLARAWRGPFGGSTVSGIEGVATHGLFISNRSIVNESRAQQEITLPESYPVEEIDAFFAALRISTGYTTGYAQLLALPVGWTASYAANLVVVDGASVENYPPSFRNGFWPDEAPSVSATEASEIVVLATNHARKLRLAIDRLNRSALRTTEEDGIVDAMIAMEALLSDDTQELTHKVAMRLGALYKLIGSNSAEAAFREIKRIYAFRSKIVHGDVSKKKDREIDRDGLRIPAIDAALQHLRTAFLALTRYPALLEPKQIDRFLLTDKMEQSDNSDLPGQ